MDDLNELKFELQTLRTKRDIIVARIKIIETQIKKELKKLEKMKND